MHDVGGGGGSRQLFINSVQDSFRSEFARWTPRHIWEDNIKRVLLKQVVELRELD